MNIEDLSKHLDSLSVSNLRKCKFCEFANLSINSKPLIFKTKYCVASFGISSFAGSDQKSLNVALTDENAQVFSKLDEYIIDRVITSKWFKTSKTVINDFFSAGVKKSVDKAGNETYHPARIKFKLTAKTEIYDENKNKVSIEEAEKDTRRWIC